ncbi:hypothetical protein MBLNU230_g4093t1 [Neophaeotheca triangularis]
MRVSSQSLGLGGIVCLAGCTAAIDLDLESTDSINGAAKTIVEDILDMYPQDEGSIPGLFSDPYYWWESGLTWDSMVNYWAKTGDDSYNDVVAQALLFQRGPEDKYMPVNQSKTLGNDDQATWALAACTAAERDFPFPETEGVDSWLQLAQNAWESQVARWNEESCGGGLKWQIFSFNAGYNYKNSMSNGMLFELSARLHSLTGNETYLDWAEETLEWLGDVGLLSENGQVFDGTDDMRNCTAINHIQWSSNSGMLLSGLAYIYNATEDPTTLRLMGKLLTAFDVFVMDETNILYEVACAPQGNCNVDQLAFLALAARGLTNVQALVSDEDSESGTRDTSARINQVLRASARAAAASCTGGDQGTLCGSDWTDQEYDGSEGLGQQLSALEVILANKGTSDGVPALGGSGLESGSSGNGTATPGSNSTDAGGTPTVIGSAVPTQTLQEPVQQTDNAAVGLTISSTGTLVAILGAVFGLGM